MNEIKEKQIIKNEQIKKDEIYVPAFVLAIISIIFFFWAVIVSYVCGTIALIMVHRKKKVAKVKSTKILAIIGLVMGVIGHFLAYLIYSNKELMTFIAEFAGKVLLDFLLLFY